jgi:hypothetical protein
LTIQKEVLTLHVTPLQESWIRKVFEFAKQIENDTAKEKKIIIKFQDGGVNVELMTGDSTFYRK